MRIISAKDQNGNNLTPEQIKADLPKLERANESAQRQEPTWNFFGGILEVNGHAYQVVA